MTAIDAETLARWETLANAATPGPWSACIDGSTGRWWTSVLDAGRYRAADRKDDVRFVASAREAVPAPIARVRELEEEVRWLDWRSR